MNVKQKILIFLGSILAVAIIVSIWIINEKYSDKYGYHKRFFNI